MKLGFLRPLYQRSGGYVSVYLDTSRAQEDAAQTVGLRWRAARDRLAAAGADQATLAAAGDMLADPAQAAPGRAVFARAGAVTFTAALPARHGARSHGSRHCRTSCRCSRRSRRSHRTCG